MQLTVTVPDDAEATRSLSQWCRRDPELRGVRIVPLTSPTRPGEMGFVGDALEFLSDNNALITAAVSTLGTWLATRAVRTRIRVRIGDREVDIDTTNPKKAQEILTRIVAELERDSR